MYKLLIVFILNANPRNQYYENKYAVKHHIVEFFS